MQAQPLLLDAKLVVQMLPALRARRLRLADAERAALAGAGNGERKGPPIPTRRTQGDDQSRARVDKEEPAEPGSAQPWSFPAASLRRSSSEGARRAMARSPTRLALPWPAPPRSGRPPGAVTNYESGPRCGPSSRSKPKTVMARRQAMQARPDAQRGCRQATGAASGKGDAGGSTRANAQSSPASGAVAVALNQVAERGRRRADPTVSSPVCRRSSRTGGSGA